MSSNKQTQAFQEELELKWRVGIRTAELISKCAGSFESEILLTHAGRTASAKSIMGILVVMISEEDTRRLVGIATQVGSKSEEYRIACLDRGLKAGFRFTLSVRGTDALEAFEVMKDLFTCGWRVDRCPEKGCSSTPILVGLDDLRIYYSCGNYHNWVTNR